jgi:hypothetical protein
MKSSVWIPVSFGLIVVVLFLIMAVTDLFQPIITYVHSQNITALQIGGCFVGAAVGFYLVYKVLVLLGSYFLPKD